MNKITKTILISLVITLSSMAEEILIPEIPFALAFENEAIDFQVLKGKGIRFSSPPKSDLFRSADGKYVVNKSPRLLFTPDRDFVLSTKIRVGFKDHWDAGDLIVYNDEKHWAKFCFETDFLNQPRVVSVVCNGTSDDANSMKVEGNEIYYRLAGSLDSKKLGLFYSTDGNTYFMIRSFFLDQIDNLRIGFCVQSPAGNGCTAEFTEIEYSATKVNNWWTGE